MRPTVLFLCLLFTGLYLTTFAEINPPRIKAVRISIAPQIDGKLDDEIWKSAQPATGFRQQDPVENADPSQKTEVRFLYDNSALYIGAMLYDSAPDSILRQLGVRDNSLNADYFNVSIDPFNSEIDAYIFEVSASGVQGDSRTSDFRYNAVWKSAVKVVENGWSVEMAIPYSALRFPKTEVQKWRLQISRTIRRHREFNQWALTPKDEDNFMKYWGFLDDIEDIDPPVRLSVTPYLSYYTEHFPMHEKEVNDWSYTFSGGADLKYGLNESFTVDMTLFPDFSQVQSDNLVKNLTAFETVFQEQRPFFREGVELFERGELFYSRRIGATTSGFYSVEDELESGEHLDKNPAKAKLLNATKISGRTAKGTGLGIFNAVTGNTYAKIIDNTGNERKHLTEPLTNFNILVLDQNLKNNSSVYLINTNAFRTRGADDANVTGAGFELSGKKGTYTASVDASVSVLHDERADELTTGYLYEAGIDKSTGNFKFSAWTEGVSHDYDRNDMGIIFERNIMEHGLMLIYNEYEPLWRLKNLFTNVYFNAEQNFTTHEVSELGVSLNMFTTFLKKYLTVFAGTNHLLADPIDYYEARETGRSYIKPRHDYFWGGWSSDYRKRLALDGNIGYGISSKYHPSSYTEFRLSPILRLTDRLSFTHSFYCNKLNYDFGYVMHDTTGQIIFGGRNVTTYINTFEGKYIFKNNLALTLRARHYWSRGEYLEFYDLQNDGTLVSNTYTGHHDFNFNAFNIDMAFSWEFAPGSLVSIVYKNAILEDTDQVEPRFFKNLGNTFEQDQLNSLSVRILYYFDVLYLKGKG